MGFLATAIPRLFKRNVGKPSPSEPKEFDVTDVVELEAIRRWKEADSHIKDIIIMGVEVSIRDIAKERPDGEVAKKLATLISARDLLWSLK
jgi:hypothetical protein